MPETIDYIFGRLSNTEDTIKKVSKVLKTQYKFNKSVVFFSLTATAYCVIATMQYKEQRAKIDALVKEVEELKSKKGE